MRSQPVKSVLHRPDLTRKVGLGDVVAAFAEPVARALGLDCIDPDTQKVLPTSPCGQRHADFNAAVPNLNPLAAIFGPSPGAAEEPPPKS